MTIGAHLRALLSNQKGTSIMGISVSLKAGKDKKATDVDATGSIEHVITDDERAAFGLQDAALKRAAADHLGRQPNQAFLKSPTPWEDLYKRFNWQQVRTVITTDGGELLDLNSHPVIVKETEAENNSSREAEINTSISDQVTLSTSSTWSTGSSFAVGNQVEIAVEPLGLGGKFSASFSSTTTIGKSETESRSETIGSDTSATVSLPPHSKVAVQLAASRGTLRARVTYTARLQGDVAVNYNPPFEGHHFYGPDVGSVMAAAGIPNQITWTQDLSVDYYSNSSVVVRDIQSGALVALHDLDGLALPV